MKSVRFFMLMVFPVCFFSCSLRTSGTAAAQDAGDAAADDAMSADNAVDGDGEAADVPDDEAGVDTSLDYTGEEAGSDDGHEEEEIGDLDPPETAAVCPDDPAGTSSAFIQLGCDDEPCTYECRIDGGEWAWCTSPVELSDLSYGSHEFEARATDSAGNPDPTPFVCAWSVVPAGISVGGEHACAIRSSGGVKCWGAGESGQLGNAFVLPSAVPVDVEGLGGRAVAVSSGAAHTCAVMDDAAVKCWGLNASGQLGDGTTYTAMTPVDVVGLMPGVRAVSAGTDHTCALTDVGSVVCWGGNGYGQLGNGTTTGSLEPVEVNGLAADAMAVSAGGYRSCAINASGGLLCWGNNSNGRLGDGTATHRSEPVGVVGLASGVAAVSNGNCTVNWALLDTGDMAYWGCGGRDNFTLVPIDVQPIDFDFTAISAGNCHACSITSIGGAMCWGGNSQGQIGNGTTSYSGELVQVVGLSFDAVDISAGGRHYTCTHTCAITYAGGIKCWGCNTSGQLGDGTIVGSNVPVDVVGFD
ncbi:MAG: hypothetical protein ABIJ56_14180 [Pseudomonadota bacterium]